ncbi:protein D2-like [Tubulanus polymorphus]|uniref:protein D2-like n=1 Tax=Tubulanus polymorphus TaxID=672921 RepID=UPI003DA6B4E4
MASEFAKHGVVKDVLDEAPPAIAKVTYNGGLSVSPGVVLTPTQVQHVPTVEWTAKEGTYYSLLMHDPDAPSKQNPKFGEWHHWCVANIPGSDVTNGEIMSEYIGSGPPKGTGLHRYVFLIYEQKAKQTFAGMSKLTNRSANGRASWKAREFAKKHDLKLVAGNFYWAEFDDYVPKLYEQMKG